MSDQRLFSTVVGAGRRVLARSVAIATVASGLYLLFFGRFRYFDQAMLLFHVGVGVLFLFAFLGWLNRHLAVVAGRRRAGTVTLLILVFMTLQGLGFHNSHPLLRTAIFFSPYAIFFVATPRRIWKRTFLSIAAIVAVMVALGMTGDLTAGIPSLLLAVWLPGYLLLNVSYYFARGKMPTLSEPRGPAMISGAIFVIFTNILVFFGLMMLDGSALAICGWLLYPIHGWGTLLWLALLSVHLYFIGKLKQGEGRPPVLKSLVANYAAPVVVALAAMAAVPYAILSQPGATNSDLSARQPMPPLDENAPVRWTTNDGLYPEPERFLLSERCGSCHKDIYRQWEFSAHSQATRSPAFLNLLQLAREEAGPQAERHCLSCHAPLAVLLPPDASESRKRQAFEAGISCGVCHEAVKPNEPFDNAGFELQIANLFMFEHAEGYDAMARQMYRMAGSEHLARFKGGFVKSAELCAGCHVQTTDAAFATHHGVMVQDTYSSWATGPYGYGAERTTTCRECHMPYMALSQVRRFQQDHRFFAKNPLRAEQAGDKDAAEYTRLWLAGDRHGFEAKSRLDFRDRVQEWKADLTGEALETRARELYEEKHGTFKLFPPEDIFPHGPLFRVEPRLTCSGPGQCALNVETTNLKVGHNFPAGSPAGADTWLEVVVTDCYRNVLFSSGVADEAGYVPAEARRFGGMPVDGDGNPVTHRRSWQYAEWRDLRFLPPQRPVEDRYAFAISVVLDAGCDLQADVRLLYRNPSRELIDQVGGDDAVVPEAMVLGQGTSTFGFP